jgi:hypothetical protein
MSSQSAVVSFTPPINNGGTPITGYTVTSSPGGIQATGPASPIQINGLTNGIPYTFTVTATNAVGTGPASTPSNVVTPATIPATMSAPTAVPGNTQAVVSFVPPSSNGGRPVTSYRVTANPGGATAAGAASPLTVTGLTNGTAYTFSVTATNSVGTSLPSPASAAVIPATIPATPAAPTAVAAPGQATVSFVPPANGGSPITSYMVTSSPGGITQTGTASPIVVPGLSNGTAYTFTVKATNAIGTSPASAPSNSVTPQTVPSTMAAPTATAGNTQATVSFVPPFNGGSPITSYTVIASSGGISQIGASSPIIVTGLVNGTPYTFTVQATNALGSGAPSPSSNSVTPSGTSLVVVIGDGTLPAPAEPTAAVGVPYELQLTVTNTSNLVNWAITAPSGFAGTVTSISNTSCIFSWPSPTAATSVTIQATDSVTGAIGTIIL